jgi:hypothetical protein
LSAHWAVEYEAHHIRRRIFDPACFPESGHGPITPKPHNIVV